MNTLDGIIVINKVPGFSTTNYTEKIKKIINNKLRSIYLKEKTIGELIEKAGHTGSLDPFASGVIVIAINNATKIIQFLNKQKKYIAEIQIGISTDTYDISGQILKQQKYSKQEINKIINLIENSLVNFIGKIEQLPPPFSAKKIQGKRAYKLSRENLNNPENKELNLNLKKHTVYIENISIINQYKDRLTIEVNCSEGTYIRSLVNDISKAIDIPLTLSFLVRTNSNNFDISQSYTLEEIKKSNNLNFIIPLQTILDNFSKVVIQDKYIFKVRNGHHFTKSSTINLNKNGIFNDKNIFTVMDKKRNHLAIAYSDNDINFKIKRVLLPF
ncbi:MAG: tRNA pseudouridine(55) synthase TruB [bacterium]